MKNFFQNIMHNKIYMFVTFRGTVFKRIYDPSLLSTFKNELQKGGFIENRDYYVREKTLND